MTRLHHNRNWKIEVFGRALTWPGGRASITIDTLDVIIGSPPTAILDEARQWAEINKDRLRVAWKVLNPR